MIGKRQPVYRHIIGKQAAIELVDRRFAELSPGVHDPENLFQPPPDFIAFGFKELILALADQFFLKGVRRKADAPAHILCKHHEDQTVEQFLRQPHRAAARHPLRALKQNLVDQHCAIIAVIFVEIAFELLFGLALFLDQPLKPSAPGIAEQHFRLEQPPEQEPVKHRLFTVTQKRRGIEKIAVFYLEPQEAIREMIPPV